MIAVDGTPERLRQFIDAGIPVLIETWLDHDGGMGHYRLVIGYDDGRGEWIVYDSYISDGIDPKGPYPGIRMSYNDLNRLWRVFNRTYVLVYDDARAAAAEAIIGEDMDDRVMWEQALAQAQAEAQANPQDAFAWFNLGSSLVALGRPADAAVAFDQARVIGLPWRMLWYQFAPFRAYYDAGRYDELVAVADATIATAGNIEETFYWKGKGLQALGDIDGARENFRRAAELNSNLRRRGCCAGRTGWLVSMTEGETTPAEPSQGARLTHITRNTLLVTFLFGLAAVAGLFRNIIVAQEFGIGAALDAYYAAFKLPDLLFAMVAGGALATAFIPIFADFLTDGDRPGAWRLASAITNLVVIVDRRAGGHRLDLRALAGQQPHRARLRRRAAGRDGAGDAHRADLDRHLRHQRGAGERAQRLQAFLPAGAGAGGLPAGHRRPARSCWRRPWASPGWPSARSSGRCCIC